MNRTLRLGSSLALLSIAALGLSQDRLPTMPRYDRYTRLRSQIFGSVKSGTLQGIRWSADGKSLGYAFDGKNYVYDLAKHTKEEGTLPDGGNGSQGNRRRRNPERGRQFDTVFSEDGSLKAFHRDRNVYISDKDGKGEYAVTTDGNAKDRTKYGIASWVYGEELNVREAMWFSPDAKTLAFYRFDESKVMDYYLAMDQGKVQDTLDTEAYPKAGAPNPVVTLFTYDLATKKTTTVETSFDSGVPDIGEYVYDVRWSPDGKELFFNRTNRKQNVMEFCAADPKTGKCRTIIRESWPKSWVENHPPIMYLDEDKPGPKRFLWISERNGFSNIYLYDLSGKLISTVTNNKFDLVRILKVDAKAGTIWYTARDGETTYRAQLHKVGLDGKGDTRLTDPKWHHTVDLSPDGKYFTDTISRTDEAPVTRICDGNGKVIEELVQSDLTKFNELGLKKTERFSFTAADGKTKCYGTLKFPSDFDPSKKYPLIVSVYGGPESGGGFDTFELPDPITEFGFLVAWIDGRGTNGRGKEFRDAVYGKLGIVEMDDQAAGVKELAKRAYVDGANVGINGTSYGGYSSLMCVLRHPEVFKAGSCSSSVTDWLNYDSIYTERFMGLPWDNENKEGYEAGSAMKYAKDLKGRLLLYFGSADNNVHPANTYQLIRALDRAGKSYEMAVGTDAGHTGVNFGRMLEFFMDHLVLDVKNGAKVAWGKREYRRAQARAAAK
ncbi:MAG: DPP IV N-terminal domain-containing protein [Armatimonadetes bacterium]|nr:DPP IV N-terminal domain-containing protein [Armatimonadota bacterium]